MKPIRSSLALTLLITVALVLGLNLFKRALPPSQAASMAAQSACVPVIGGPALLHGGIAVSAAQLQELAVLTAQRSHSSDEREESENDLEREEFEHERDAPQQKAAPATQFNPLVSHPEALLAQQLPQTPVAVTQWDALDSNRDGGGFPPDTQISVSRTHVVVTANSLIGFYDKAGKRLQTIGISQFFSPLNMDVVLRDLRAGLVSNSSTGYFDLRTIYDPFRKRFWICALAYTADAIPSGNDTSPCLNNPLRKQHLTKAVVAVSKTESPLDGFYLYWWDAVAGDGTAFKTGKAVGERGNHPGDAADYPYLAVDEKFVIQTNTVDDNFLCQDNRTNHLIYFPADHLAQGLPGLPAGYEMSVTECEFSGQTTLAPALHHDASQRTFLAATYPPNKAFVYALSDHLAATPKLERIKVDLNANFNYPVQGPQKTSCAPLFFTNGGISVMNAVYRNGFLSLICQDSEDWFNDGQQLTSVRLARMQVSNFPNIPKTANLFTDRRFGKNSATEDTATARMYYGWPAHEVNKNNDLVAVYARTGTTIFPEVRFSLYSFGAGETDIRPSRLLQNGLSYYGSLSNCDAQRWGDNAGAAVDPYDDTAIWVAQAYANAEHGFRIAVGKVLGEKHPDLIVQDVQTVKPVYKPGETLNLITTIRNQGDGNHIASAATDLYLSKDPIISFLDQRIATVTLAQLSAGAVTSLGSSYALPGNIEPGIYWVGAIIGPQTGEYSTTNNLGRGAHPVIIRAENANTFLPSPGTRWHSSFGFNAEVPASGDFNGDGKDDICAFNKTDGAVYVALSDGTKFNGSGDAARWISGFSIGQERPLVGDFNGDGKADIVTLVQNAKGGVEAKEVYVALSTGTKFGPKTKWSDDFFDNPNNKILVGDFNGDGKDDLLAVTSPSSGSAHVLLSDGQRFSPYQSWFNNFVSFGSNEGVGVGDFNGDGLTDIASFNPNNGAVLIAISSGSNFINRSNWNASFAGGTELPLTGDFNGNGKTDAIAFTRGAAGDVFVALSNGAKLLDPREKWHDQFAVGTETPLIGDFNGDGADDIATFTLGSTGDVFVSLARRKPLGLVSAASFSTTAFAPDSIVAAFGLNLATGTQAASVTPLPTTLLGARVTVTDKNSVARLAPLFFVSPGQINFLVPPGTAIGAATIKIEDGAGFVSTDTFNIERLAPGLFTANASGQDVPAAVLVRVRNGVQTVEPVATFDQRTSRFVPVPIDLGPVGDQVVLVLFGTGLRGNNGPANITCRMNRMIQPVLFAGAQGGFVGLDQVNVLLPRTLMAAGDVALDLVVENSFSNSVKINVK